jgi:uncharacterized protein (DUF4415 family)
VAPLLDEEWFKSAKLVLPERKVPISMRVDREVLEWFRAQGSRYLSRMNAVLKAMSGRIRNVPPADPEAYCPSS